GRGGGGPRRQPAVRRPGHHGRPDARRQLAVPHPDHALEPQGVLALDPGRLRRRPARRGLRERHARRPTVRPTESGARLMSVVTAVVPPRVRSLIEISPRLRGALTSGPIQLVTLFAVFLVGT